MLKNREVKKCSLCNSTDLIEILSYTAPPVCEIAFKFSKDTHYFRKYFKCSSCGHFISSHEMDLTELYSGEYVAANYQDLEGINNTFTKIINLDSAISDNVGRSKRIHNFCLSYFSEGIDQLKLLDVGSGLGVFPYEMKKFGWECVAIDPDSTAVIHLKKNVGVPALQGDFLKMGNIGTYDVITFNKVLEHVAEPIAMLKKSKDYCNRNSIVYVELPDAEMALLDGKEREEFTIDHLNVFSFQSIIILSQKAGFVPILVERLKEPSGKYTLRAFLKS